MKIFVLGCLVTNQALATATPAPEAPPTPTASQAKPEAPVAQVRWNPFRNDSFAFEPKAEGEECELVLGSVAAPSQGVLLTGGRVRCPATGSRSALLRSTDQGKSWVEVGTPLTGRSASHLSFVTPLRGFLLVTHREEGPGPDALFATSDAGLTWTFVREIPKGIRPHLAVAQRLAFENAKEGNLVLRVFSREGQDFLVTLQTLDGGRNWEFWEAVPSPKGTPTPAAEPGVKLAAEWLLDNANSHWIIHRFEAGTRQDLTRIPIDVPFKHVAQPRPKK